MCSVFPATMSLKLWGMMRPPDAFQIPFTKDCGSDDVCTSDLVLSVTSNTQATR